MKILISSDTYYPQVNGASYFTQRLAFNLQAHGHDVLVVAPGETFAYTDTRVNGVRVFGVRSYPVFFYKTFRFCILFFKNSRIEKVVRDFKPDVIHIQGHFAVSRIVVGIALRNKIPLVATNHFMPENLVHYIPFNSIIGTPIKNMAWRDFSKIFKKVGEITTPTQTAADLIQPYFKKRIIPISCGMNLSMFNKDNDGEYLKKRYGISESPILLYVGRLDKEKSLDFVLRSLAVALKASGRNDRNAATSVATPAIDMQFVIAGSGAEKARLIALSEELGIRKNVVFTGFVPDADLPNLYAIADCFIIAGTAELQSLVTMEAMASGLPVLGVNAVALPELVKDGRNGFLFEHGNIIDLAQKITAVFSDKALREKMGAESLTIVSEHDINKSIKKFEEVYKNEIGKYDNKRT